MPHTTRTKSGSGFYHVVVKGDGGQILFEDETDRTYFLSCLSKALATYPAKLHAYCLMSNHVHMLIEDTDDSISQFMKLVDETYGRYYARKTGRVGHVFQDVFWSEPIESDERFLQTLRYIHANPEPAGICEAAKYDWSSYQAYASGICSTVPVSTSMALGLLGGSEEFVLFQGSGAKYAKPFPGSKLQRHLSPDEQTRVAQALLGRETLANLRTLIPAARLSALLELSRAGFTDSEISRLTGLGQVSVYRALKNVNQSFE